MPDSEIAAVLRTVLEELCTELSLADAGTRTNVASKLLRAAEQGHCSLDHLREIGKEALHKAPTMWR
jgi:hypothetical protein